MRVLSRTMPTPFSVANTVTAGRMRASTPTTPTRACGGSRPRLTPPHPASHGDRWVQPAAWSPLATRPVLSGSPHRPDEIILRWSLVWSSRVSSRLPLLLCRVSSQLSASTTTTVSKSHPSTAYLHALSCATTLPPRTSPIGPAAIFQYTDPIFSTTWKFDFSSLCNDETDYLVIDNTTSPFKFVRRTFEGLNGRASDSTDLSTHRTHPAPSPPCSVRRSTTSSTYGRARGGWPPARLVR